MEKYEIKLKDIVKEVTGGKYTDLFTREIGRIVFLRLEDELRKIKDDCVVFIDFLEIGAIDYSCADEIFAHLIINLQHSNYGDKFIIFKNLSPHHKENIQIVLEKKDLAVLVVEENNWTVLGSLDNYLLQTLKTIIEEGKLSSPELSSRLNLALNTASMRLGNLSKLRLVRKKNSVNSSGKRCFIYESIINN